MEKQQILDRVVSLAPNFAERAQEAEQNRTIPYQSIKEMIEAGLARVLVPKRYGGEALGLEIWFETAREIGKADGSHGWCASLLTHHAHMLSHFPAGAQDAVWADGPDVPIAASLMPVVEVTQVSGGFRISGQHSANASGVNHSKWAILGGFLHGDGSPEWLFFLLSAKDYEVRETWFTAGMRGTGSNTIVTENVFVPNSHVLKLADLKEGAGSGAPVEDNYIFSTKFFFYAPLTFLAPMLGAAQGSYEYFREWNKTRKGPGGAAVAEMHSIQIGMARAAADIDAADLLLRRALAVPASSEAKSTEIFARSVRDFTRSSELLVGAMDALVALGGTSGFAEKHPIQRAWRDIHMASTHIALKADGNYSHFARMEFGLPKDHMQPYI